MKKILSFFSAFILLISTTLTLVACGPSKPETDVLFLMPGVFIRQKHRIRSAYEYIVEEFNESEEMQDSPIKMKAVWEADNAVNLRYISGQQLPDLYISYPDGVSDYVLNPQLTDQVRNIEKSIDYDTDLKEIFWSSTFYDEGTVQDQLYLLPMNKSFDFTILNLKVFLELVSFVDSSLEKKLGTMLQDNGLTNEKTHLFFPLKEGEVFNFTQENLNLENLKQELEKINNLDDLRKFFVLDANVLNLVGVFNNLYRKNLNLKALKQDYIGPKGDEKLVYALGLDTPDNKIFMEYADALKEGKIDPQSEAAKKFLYNIENINPEEGSLDLFLDNPESEIFQGIASFFNQLQQWAPTKDGSNADERWSGVMNHGLINNKFYSAGNYFNQGTMLTTSSTSAGSRDYVPDLDVLETKTPQYNRQTDLMILPAPTVNGNQFNFLQQGAGIAGFKSVGRNAPQKEAVVTKFLNYLLTPKNQTKLAIMAGYVPSTTKALEMFQNYKSGNFDNTKGEWRNNDSKPENSEDYKQIPDAVSQEFKNESDPLITDFLNNYVLNGANIVTLKANPLGTVVRNSLKNSLRDYIFKNPDKYQFADLLSEPKEGMNKRNLVLQIQGNLPGSYKNTKIKIRK